MADPRLVAARFAHDAVGDLQEFGDGRINDTYLVSAGTEKFILQKINGAVFPQPELIIENMRTVTEYLRGQIAWANPVFGGRQWQVPLLMKTRDEKDFVVDEQGGFWRALSFIADVETFAVADNAGLAFETGFCLGWFHRLLSGLEPEKLHDTLPGFHNTPGYLRQYERDLAVTRLGGDDQDLQYCHRFVFERMGGAAVLENAREMGLLALRPIHGDPKVDNILFAVGTGKAVGIIDLDTVKPGLIHYDIGDCLRSCCNPAGEDPADTGSVFFDVERCKAALSGYIMAAGDSLQEADYGFIFEAVRLISFELGMRFLSDYLAGNSYFKVMDPRQNLRRAMVQFRLVESIEKNEQEINSIINLCRDSDRK